MLTSTLLALALSTSAAITSEKVEYKDASGTVLQGVVVYDNAKPGKHPGVLVIHDWMGLSADTEMRARELAEQGYVAFAADIYGKGVRPTDVKGAAEQATKYKTDRKLMRVRATAALDVLLARKDVDAAHVAAIGFCFGGTTAIELAKSGARLAGVVSFHGGLDAPVAGESKRITGKVLVLHGAADPFVPQKDIDAFLKDLNDAKVDWTMTSYAGAVHAFTVKAAGTDPSKGAAYDDKASKRAFAAMKSFFAEIFG